MPKPSSEFPFVPNNKTQRPDSAYKALKNKTYPPLHTSSSPPLFLSASLTLSALNYFPFLENTSFVPALRTICPPSWLCLECFDPLSSSDSHWRLSSRPQQSSSHRPPPCHSFTSLHFILFRNLPPPENHFIHLAFCLFCLSVT